MSLLFCSQTKRDAEHEPIYKALNQSLNAMVYHRNSVSIIPETTSSQQNITHTIEYPLIVCNSFDKFFRTEIDSNNDPVVINDNFQLEVNYAYMDTNKEQKNEFFLIEVIDYNKLDDFLEVIKDDVGSILQVIDY